MSGEKSRTCPACGMKVAARARMCIICEAPLTDQEERPAPAPVPRAHRSQRGFWLAAVLTAAVVVGVAYWLLGPYLLPERFPTPAPPPTPTRTPTPAATSTPIPTPTETPTPTPLPPRAHQVQFGDTLSSIAVRYDMTLEEIIALNPGINPDSLQIGQVLLIPPARPTPTPLPGTVEPPTPPGDYLIHVVAPGETLISIAQKYSVTVSLIRAANPEIPAGSDVIGVNQPLIIPLGTPMPTPTPTPDPNATPTPIPLYPAPPLLTPPDGAVFGGPDARIVLQWASVAILRPNEWYELRLVRPGMPITVIRTRTTAYRVPADMYPPPTSRAREFRWKVRVVRETSKEVYTLASDPQLPRKFFWLESPPTPTPSPIP